MYLMGEGIDTGRVVRQFPVAVKSGESFVALYLRLCIEAGRRLPEIAAAIVAGTAPTVIESTAADGTYHGWPDDEVRAGLRANKRHLMNLAGLMRLVAGLPRPRRARA
jgi:methionyl-tRNA formyltransferase